VVRLASKFKFSANWREASELPFGHGLAHRAAGPNQLAVELASGVVSSLTVTGVRLPPLFGIVAAAWTRPGGQLDR